MTIIHLNKAAGLKGHMRSGAIGPQRDPYGYTELVISLPHGDAATLYEDGLGTLTFELLSNHEVTRTERFCDYSKPGDENSQRSLFRLKANLLAKRRFGFTFNEVKERVEAWLYEAETRDPMGSRIPLHLRSTNMSFKPYFIRSINRPAPLLVQRASGGMCVRVPIGHEVQFWHFGEDGPAPVLIDLRGPVFLDDQAMDWGHMQDWYCLEVLNQAMLDSFSEEPCSVHDAIG